MKKALLFLALLLASPCWGSIAFVNVGHGSATSGNTVTITYTSTIGNMMVITYDTKVVGATVSNITDSTGGSITWTIANAINNGATGREEVWTSGLNAASVTSVVLHLAATTTDSVAHLGEYSGVVAIGINATNTGTGTSLTVSLTTQDNNNFVVAGLGDNFNQASSGSVGNLRQSTTGSGCNDSLNDNTKATPGVTANTVTDAVSHSWQAVAVELRTVATVAGGGAQAKIRKLETIDPQ